MLTEEEKKKIKAQIKQFPQPKNAGIEALNIVQENRGWISDELLREIAGLLEMAPDELDSVATFYNLVFRKPVGKHVILICDSISSWVMGYRQLADRIKKHLGIDFGETTEDGRFTLLTIPCLGTCDRAPAMMINNDLYRDISPDKVEEILGQYD